MHKIFELKEMEIEKLQALANDLGVKGFKKMDKEALVYAILDAEAIKSAQSPIERPAKKRGRPAKSEAPKQEEKPTVEAVAKENNIEEKPAEEKETNTPKEQQSKKRGRKPKSQNKPAENHTPAEEVKETELQQPVKQEKENQDTPKQPKAKRERIKKGQKPSAEPINVAPVESIPEQKPQEKPAEAPVEQPAPKQQDNQRNKGNKHQNDQRPQKPQEPVIEFDGVVEATGVLEIMPDGYGFLRSSDYNYLNSPDERRKP